MSHSWPTARHCMPQIQTHQIAMIALRSAAPVNGGLGPERVRRVPSAAMAASSVSTSSTKASMSENASHEAGEVLAVLTAVPPYAADPMAVAMAADRAHRPPARQPPFTSK